MNNINWLSYKSSIHIDPAWKKRAAAAMTAYAKKTSNQTEQIYGTKHSLTPFKIAVALAVFALFAISPAAIASAKYSRPGQLLYPLKRLTENVKLAVATNTEAKTAIQINQTVERTNELSVSIEKDRQDQQLKAVAEVEATRKELEKLPSEIKRDTYRKIRERLEAVKEKARHEIVKKRLEAIIASFEDKLDEVEVKKDEGNPSPTPTNKPQSPTPANSSSSSGGSSSEVHVETNNGYTEIIINGNVVVTVAPSQNESKIDVKVRGGSVKVNTNSNVNSHSVIDLQSDD